MHHLTWPELSHSQESPYEGVYRKSDPNHNVFSWKTFHPVKGRSLSWAPDMGIIFGLRREFFRSSYFFLIMWWQPIGFNLGRLPLVLPVGSLIPFFPCFLPLGPQNWYMSLRHAQPNDGYNLWMRGGGGRLRLRWNPFAQGLFH